MDEEAGRAPPAPACREEAAGLARLVDALRPARFLSVADAAAYVGVSASTFLAEVEQGLWPPPLRRGSKRTRLTWDRRLIDAHADRLSGLGEARPAAAGTTSADLTAAAAAAAEAKLIEKLHAPTPPGARPQRRHQAPA
jgi:predicted DNA-binding transcriptional regulator AlpA